MPPLLPSVAPSPSPHLATATQSTAQAHRTAKITSLILTAIAFLPALLLLWVAWKATYPASLSPGRDSGVFLYAGWSWLHGHIPYADTWDHKGPLLYAINALMVFCDERYPHSIFWLGGATFLAALWFCFQTLHESVGRFAACFGCILWTLLLPRFLDGGNFTEQYALVCQFAALWCLWRLLSTQKPIYALTLGAVLAATLLLRPNLAALPFLCSAFIVVHPSRFKRCIPWLVASFVLSMSIVIGYFAALHALDDLFDQYLRYNIMYAHATTSQRLEAFAGGMGLLGLWAAVFAASWGIVALKAFKKSSYPNTNDAQLNLTRVVVVAAIFDFVLPLLSGRSYSHYFLTWLPCAIFCVALALHFAMLDHRALSNPPRRVLLAIGLGLILFLGVDKSHLKAMFAPLPQPVENSQLLAARFLLDRTRPAQKVLVWGSDCGVNFLAKRRSPSRYAYQYALWTANYQTPSMLREFSEELQTDAPLFIIDVSPSDPIVPPLSVQARNTWKHSDALAWSQAQGYKLTPGLEALMNRILHTYHPVGTIGLQKWPIYRLNGAQPGPSLSSGK